MKFTKMHGTGNDYIYVNCAEEKIEDPSGLSRKFSKRRFGIGADGLVLIDKGKDADFSMRIFNADCSEAEMCGNAIRCVGKYVYEKGLTGKDKITIETKAGIKKLEMQVVGSEVRSVRVDMGPPILNGKDIPVNINKEKVVRES